MVLTIALAGLMSIGYGMDCCAQGTGAATKADTADTSGTGQAKVKPVNNEICPISGQKVGSMEPGANIVYDGYKVGLCCSGCKEKFMKDPATNLKKAQDSVKK
jgi:hypothetical protein